MGKNAESHSHGYDLRDRARATLHTDRREIAPGYYAMVTGTIYPHDSSVTCEKRRRKIVTSTVANFDLINRATNTAGSLSLSTAPARSLLLLAS